MLSAISDTRDRAALDAGAGRHPDRRARQPRRLRRRPSSCCSAQTLLDQLSLIKGDTTFKPPDFEFRLTPVFNFNYTEVEERRVLFAEPGRGKTPQRRLTSACRSLPRLPPAQRLGALRLRLDARRHPAVHLATSAASCSRTSSSACASSAPATTTAGSTTSAWFRRAREGHQQRPERHRGSACARTTSSSPTSTARTSRSSASPRRRPCVHNRNREGDAQYFDDNGFLARPAGIGDRAAAQLRRDLPRLQRRRPLRPART